MDFYYDIIVRVQTVRLPFKYGSKRKNKEVTLLVVIFYELQVILKLCIPIITRYLRIY